MKRALIWISGIFAAIALLFGALVGFVHVAEPIENAEPRCGSEECDFRITSRNLLGNQNIWIYGENEAGYFYWYQVDYEDPHPWISRDLASRCDAFDALDVLTWAPCGADIQVDCVFIIEAKATYETNSSASEDLDRYVPDASGGYTCDL